jgi:TetR/AcrR family transcriptional repressor of uid operon
MSQEPTDPIAVRQEQILQAAMICFAKRGFHLTTMHDISAEAKISVGLIYRYFQNKDAVISAMAEEHQREILAVLDHARQAPSLLEALEILFTAPCCENSPRVHSAFVVDLFAEAGRNPHVAELVSGITETAMDGLTDLISKASERHHAKQNLAPREMAELIFATSHGVLMHDVLDLSRASDDQRRERQLMVLRNLWCLLFGERPKLQRASTRSISHLHLQSSCQKKS